MIWETLIVEYNSDQEQRALKEGFEPVNFAIEHYLAEPQTDNTNNSWRTVFTGATEVSTKYMVLLRRKKNEN